MTDSEMQFEVRADGHEPELAERLMRDLPEWFGIEESILEYVAAARRLPTLVARDGSGDGIGILLLERHFPEAAEIHLMAVAGSWHRRGVGRALVRLAESIVRGDGGAMLSVKTLGPSHPDVGYGLTRAFYQACGFLPIEELDDLWPGNPCLILVKPLTEGG
jgi:GNAT superfamily N-acetyltransferase